MHFALCCLLSHAPWCTCAAPAGTLLDGAKGFNGIAAFTQPNATDNVDGAVPVKCDVQPGDSVPLGGRMFTCWAQDSSNNTGTCNFTIMVGGSSNNQRGGAGGDEHTGSSI